MTGNNVLMNKLLGQIEVRTKKLSVNTLYLKRLKSK